jgi:hypothetical protein
MKRRDRAGRGWREWHESAPRTVVRFIGDDIRHAPRRWKTSPHFPGLEEQLPPGAALDHPLFPVVWSYPDGNGDIN